jgi:hypothetical protein
MLEQKTKAYQNTFIEKQKGEGKMSEEKRLQNSYRGAGGRKQLKG